MMPPRKLAAATAAVPDAFEDRVLSPRAQSGRSPVPLYYRISTALEASIRSGKLAPGARVPGERELAQEYGVSPITARAAMRMLLDQNLIVRYPGRGTFVTDWNTTKGVWGLDSMEALLNISSKARLTLVGWNRVATPAWVDDFVPGAFDRRCLQVQLVRRSDNVPFLITNAYYPADIEAQLRKTDFTRPEVRNRLAISIVEEKCGLAVSEVRQSMSAELADAPTANHLGLRRGAPILTVVRENYTQQGKLIQLAKSYYRTDRYRFVVNLSQVDASRKNRSWT